MAPDELTARARAARTRADLEFLRYTRALIRESLEGVDDWFAVVRPLLVSQGVPGHLVDEWKETGDPSVVLLQKDPRTGSGSDSLDCFKEVCEQRGGVFTDFHDADGNNRGLCIPQGYIGEEGKLDLGDVEEFIDNVIGSIAYWACRGRKLLERWLGVSEYLYDSGR
ncbi:hypothetical protein [Demequina sp. NBRC 110054]|uniref:hypothetical protein n=1 Tax=Demequina sp. NBRC 110054 TaxID=1570343 RepID=UPI000A02ED3D|nr:hypothetical protein [Demequina sp. NBRC 110054]